MRKFNLIMNKYNKISYGYKFKLFWNDFFDKRAWRRRCRNCNIVGIIRDIFIAIIIVLLLFMLQSSLLDNSFNFSK